MSVAREHNEWLSLVETSGPFLSLPVLQRVFPQGLEKRDPDQARLLRQAYEEWQEFQDGGRRDAALHRAWAGFILRNMLEFPDEVLAEGQSLPQALKAEVREHGETLRPDLAVLDPGGGQRPRLLIQILPPEQNLDKPLAGRHWKASPSTRMMELLHAADCRLGLITNGEHWMLVNAPRGETTGFASWYAHLWLEEPLTLRAFLSLLSARRFFSVPENETLEALLAESATDQQEVTDQLGHQVREAVELLIESLDRADQDKQRGLLSDIPDERLYEAALAVMMRLVFLFCAEERELLPVDDPLYSENYAVSTMQEELRHAAGQHTEDVLERRFDAWRRLLAVFRAVHGGVRHDRLNLPAYGGHLFDPDRYPFLEGRPAGSDWRTSRADPLPVDNRTVLHLLEALQFLQVPVPGGGPAERRRLSFRALDIEQIGHVYEGLLDHTARRASGVVLSLKGSQSKNERKEPEIELGGLERLRERDEDRLIEFLRKQTGRSAAALRNDLARPPALEGREQHRWLAVCGNDPEVLGRVRAFAGLVRESSFGRPVVFLPGSVYVTSGTSRRTSSSYYTPRSLTEPVVQYTLEPAAYEGPAEGKPPEEWKLRPPRELLELKICDLACGSGAFLVQTCRYLSELLVEAWGRVEERRKAAGEAPPITPYGEPSQGAAGESLIPAEAGERLIYARRLVAGRCLYGVDKNPLAVEMAKLSLWLITLDKGRPFTFLDHAIKCGDSLLGVSGREQMETFHLLPRLANERQKRFEFWENIARAAVRTADEKRRRLEAFPVVSLEELGRKERLLAEAEEAAGLVRIVCDLLAGAAMDAVRKTGRGLEAVVDEFEAARDGLFTAYLSQYADANTLSAQDAIRNLSPLAAKLLDEGKPPDEPPRRPFHWPLEFPEVFTGRGGFDAVVGNPPFMGGKKITGPLGKDYRDYLVQFLANGHKGHADICAYVFLRAAGLVHERAGFGLLATNTIAQGDTREVGFDQLTAAGCVIPRAVPSRKWPGGANLEVAQVWVRRDGWKGPYVLEDRNVEGITAFLTTPGAVTGKPYRLAANKDKSFQGSIVLGMGFVLEPEEAEQLIEQDARNEDVLFPYLNGDDLNSQPDQWPTRWVINFRDWPLRRGAPGSWERAGEKQRKQWLRAGAVPDDYSDPVAADYPDCLAIVEEKVKSERATKAADVAKAPWWQFWRVRPKLYATIAGMERVLVTARVSKHWGPAFIDMSHVVSSEATVVFATSNYSDYAVLQSTTHYSWAQKMASSLETRLRYTPSDCYETFAFPSTVEKLENFGSE